MVRVLRQRTRRVAIEGLGIEQRFDPPFTTIAVFTLNSRRNS